MAVKTGAVTQKDKLSEIISLLTDDLQSKDLEEEYRRMPWIWRVAIAVGKRNDGGEIRDVLAIRIPGDDEQLRDWQSVVIGGGLINGMSQLGIWPKSRLAEILDGLPAAKTNWPRTLRLSAAMADDKRVRAGTVGAACCRM